MKSLLLATLVLLASCTCNAQAEELVIGVKSAEPFTYQNVHGKWIGLSIDLLDEIAQTEGFTYKIKELPSTPALINAAAMAAASGEAPKATSVTDRLAALRK